ncbi:MAG: hypothetical protein O2840_04335 [bacterium]|nr:hypothetical protein [bacterium]
MFQNFLGNYIVFSFFALVVLVGPLFFYLFIFRKRIKRLNFRRKAIVTSLVALLHFLATLVVGYHLGRWLDNMNEDAGLLFVFFPLMVPGGLGAFVSCLIFLIASLFEVANILANWVKKRVDKKRAQTFFVLLILLLMAIVAGLFRFYLDKV